MAMAYAKVDFKPMLVGSYLEWNIQFNQMQDGIKSPLSLVDNSIRFRLTRYDGDSDTEILLEKNISVHVDAANGKSKLVINSEDTEELTPGLYTYTIDVILGTSTNVIKWAKGLFPLEK